MINKVRTISNLGLVGYEIIVESDSNRALPTIEIVGLPDAAIRESKVRIRATFRNLGLEIPRKKVILNLAPSDIKKIGTRFDLPLAVAILLLIHEKEIDLDGFEENIFLGELGLDGNVKRVNGILPSVISAIGKGYRKFYVPKDNLGELMYIKDIEIYPLENFHQIVEKFLYGYKIEKCIGGISKTNFDDLRNSYDIDFEDIKGQILAKRALMIAASGMHNLLMLGPPGSGKTMLAKSINTILPPLSFDEILEISQIYSVIGKLSDKSPLIFTRPFRSVHHTASKISIIGGGANLTPGEISLAHKGVLFFDELAEFPRDVLEVLRQPLEDKKITISRVSGTVDYPSHFMFVSAMNPCKCGYFKDKEKRCICSINQIKKYQSRISGPLLDRFDMIIEVPRENIEKILDRSKEDSSEYVREQILRAWDMQQRRFEDSNIKANSLMGSKDILKYIVLENESEDFLKKAVKSLVLSPRVVHRILKLSRTIADLQGEKVVRLCHLSEALQYRSKSMFVDEGL